MANVTEEAMYWYYLKDNPFDIFGMVLLLDS